MHKAHIIINKTFTHRSMYKTHIFIHATLTHIHTCNLNAQIYTYDSFLSHSVCCVCVYMCKCVYVYMHIFIHETWMHRSIYKIFTFRSRKAVYVYICVYVYVYICTYSYMRLSRTDPYIKLLRFAVGRLCICVYVYMCICVCVYVCNCIYETHAFRRQEGGHIYMCV